MHKLLSVVLAAFIALSAIAFPAAPAAAVEIYAGNTDRTFLGTTSVTDLVVSGTLGVTGASTFSDTATFNKTPQQGVAETLSVWKVTGVNGTDDGDNVAKLELVNDTTADDNFRAAWKATGASTAVALNTYGLATTDTGSNSVMSFTAQTAAGANITTRPLFTFQNWNGNGAVSFLPLNSGANLALSWGTQAGADPTFTTRSTGSRLVFYNQVGASAADYALGFNTISGRIWTSVASSTANLGWDWFGGITKAMTLSATGNLALPIAGSGISFKEGSNCKMGAATLVGGTVTVSTTAVTANSRIFLTKKSGAGTRGILEVGTITAGTSFVINSVDSAGALVADTSVVQWVIIEAG